MKRRTFVGIGLTVALLAGCMTPQAVAPTPSQSALVVMTSGGYAEALDRLEPQIEQALGHDILIVKGSSTGGAADSIPERLKRGERADMVILSSDGLALLEQGKFVQAGTRRDLVRSVIGMAVRKGAPVPDISSPERFVAVLRAAPSIGYSASASGTYLATDLWPRLGLAKELLPKSRRILSERVGAVVARGEVELGLQQMSELLPIPGITVVGPIPDAYQKVTVFTAAQTPAGAANPLSKRLIAFLTSPQVTRQVAATGLDPVIAQ